MKEWIYGVAIGAIAAIVGSILAGFVSAATIPSDIAGTAFRALLWEVGIQLWCFGVVSFVLMFFAVKVQLQRWKVAAIVAFLVFQLVLAYVSWPYYYMYPLQFIMLGVCLALGGVVAVRSKALNSDAASGALARR